MSSSVLRGEDLGGDGLGSPSDLTGWPAWSLFRKKLIVVGGLGTITKCVAHSSVWE